MQNARHGRIAVRIARRRRSRIDAHGNRRRTHEQKAVGLGVGRTGCRGDIVGRAAGRYAPPRLGALGRARGVCLVGYPVERKIRERDELEVACDRVLEHQAIGRKIECGLSPGQDTREHRTGEVARGIELERLFFAGADLGVHREDQRLAGARHRHIEQTRPLLEAEADVLIAHIDICLGGGTRGAHIVHQLGREPCGRVRASLNELLELCLELAALEERAVARAHVGKARRQRHDLRRAPAPTRLESVGARLDAKALRDRHHRELQALGRMDGHDAHRAGTALVKRAGRLLAREERIVGERRRPRA